jgi:hypothetical protein
MILFPNIPYLKWNNNLMPNKNTKKTTQTALEVIVECNLASIIK